MELTPRAVWENVSSLRRAGMLRVRTKGRRLHFTVNLDAAFLHPTMSGFTLRPFLSEIVGQTLAPQENVRGHALPQREPSMALAGAR